MEIRGMVLSGVSIKLVPYTVTLGTKAPALGAGGQNPFPAAGWTPIWNSSSPGSYPGLNQDDSFTEVTLPFTFTFNNTPYTSFFPSSNFYITFGTGSGQYSGLAASSPPYDKIFFSGADNSWQRVSTITTKTDYTRIRFEGTNSTSGTPGSPTMVYELTFFNPTASRGQQWIELLIGNQNGSGISGIYGPNTQLSGGQIISGDSSVAANQSYVFVGDLTGTNWTVNTGYYVNGTDY